MARSNSKLTAKTKISTTTVPRKAPVKPKFRSGNVGLLTEKIVATVKKNKENKSTKGNS